MFGIFMTLFLVVPAADADGVKEAIGRCWAADAQLPYPSPGFNHGTQQWANCPDDGSFDDPGCTYYYQNYEPSLDQTEAAFLADATVQACQGRTFTTFADGEVTIPSTTPVELADEWFWWFSQMQCWLFDIC